MIRNAILAVALTLLLPALCFSYDLYVTSARAAVYPAPDVDSGKLFDLASGTRMSGIAQKGHWHKVEYQGRKGWVYTFLVNTTPPVKREDIYGAGGSVIREYEEFSGRARKRPSAYTAAAAARGLKEMRRRFSSRHRLDYAALEKMESRNIPNSQAMNFLAQGVSND